MGPMIRLLLPLLLLLPVGARALESVPVQGAHSTATLLTDVDSVRPGQPFHLALRLQLAPGWHTYWLNPGDAGEPPALEVTGSKTGPIAFPTPSRLQDGPFTSYAYTGEVVLPAPATAPAGGGPLHLGVHATWLACEKICVPEEGQFSLDLPAGDGAAGAQAAVFTHTAAASPRPSPFPTHIGPDGTLRVEAAGLAPTALYFFPAEAGIIDQGATQDFRGDSDGVSVRLKPASGFRAGKPLAGILTLTDRTGAREALWIEAPPGAGVASTSPALPRALGLAFLGGLILNLMPCVLPVLAMKALALARLSGEARHIVRREAALYTAGVLTAFAAIGAVTLAAGAAGQAAGWGMQFQSPVFTAAMAWLMLAIGLNFTGLFEIGASAAGVGQGLAARGSFFTGLLAVAVATPCTAPFMATALAAAIVLPPAGGMAVFLALGAGLAAPYALLAVAPGLARLLPRPGRWMLWLRQVLALPMFAAATWLGWVVWRQSGGAGLALALLGAILVGAAALVWGREPRERARQLGTAGALGGAAAVALLLSARVPQTARTDLVAGAERFSPERLASLRAAHRSVFVDMSAAWCITCLVNERLALAPAEVRAAFAQRNVAYLVGDWTRQDAAITDYLRTFGRDGVPLYVYYPADGAPQVLPQILTEADVLGRLGG